MFFITSLVFGSSLFVPEGSCGEWDVLMSDVVAAFP